MNVRSREIIGSFSVVALSALTVLGTSSSDDPSNAIPEGFTKMKPVAAPSFDVHEERSLETTETPALEAQTPTQFTAVKSETFTTRPSQIDLMWVYTPQALKRIGSKEEIQARAQSTVYWMNRAARDSGAPFAVNLVATVPTRTYDSPSIHTSLNRIANPRDGYYDDVIAAKKKYGADAVQMVTGVTPNCGVGFVGPNPAALYSVLSADCSSIPSAAVHEFGHNLGLKHDRATMNELYTKDSNYGYVDLGAQFSTVMAYTSSCTNARKTCTELLRFSNPRQSYMNRPLGIPTGRQGSADAVSTIKSTAPKLSAASSRSGYPLVLATTPASLSGNAVSSLKPSARFNESVRNVTTKTFTMRNLSKNVNVPGRVSYSSKTKVATFIPSRPLSSNTRYQMKLSSSITDGSRLRLPETTWRFSTGPRPLVKSITPANGSRGAATTTNVTLNFTKSMKWTRAVPYLKASNGTTVPVSYYLNRAKTSFVLNPTSNLRRNTMYTVVVPGGMTDAYGNPLSPRTLRFVTR